MDEITLKFTQHFTRKNHVLISIYFDKPFSFGKAIVTLGTLSFGSRYLLYVCRFAASAPRQR